MNKIFYTFFAITLLLFGCDENADRNQAFIKGRDALKQKDFTVAKTQLQLSVKYDSNFAEAWNNLGIAHTELEEYHEAINAYNKAILIDSCLQDAYQNKANLLYLKDEKSKAIALLSQGLNCNLENKSLLLNRATLYQDQKMYEKALEDLRALKRLVAEDDVLYTNLGYCFFELEELDSAFHYSVVALEINPKRDEAANNLGMIAMKKKESEDAYKFFKKAVDIKPQNSLYRANVAKAAIEIGKLEEACKNVKMAKYYNSKGNYDSLISMSCKE
ncbi:tetratricopeptide repeat protein [Flammeovirga aprica]|uniref:Tetratricopeptide repeat protein n=1 Tax=Flammeovirga aprica JL-4 TaxID=694437 RepID=A0A7X9P0J4_9BACT|nr:tetratricopeptide repeat protein [Flammeovirga aprica]NME67100.1 tetratricopeptide repeat protein [Flammeovirga aprica JL-4]